MTFEYIVIVLGDDVKPKNKNRCLAKERLREPKKGDQSLDQVKSRTSKFHYR